MFVPFVDLGAQDKSILSKIDKALVEPRMKFQFLNGIELIDFSAGFGELTRVFH